MSAAAHSADALLQPFSLKSLDLRNRLVMAPMTRCFSPGGVPGSDVADYYRRRAEGGVGLIVTEGTWVPHVSASNDPNVPRFYGEDALAGWNAVVDGVHAANGKIVPQLWHVGLVTKPTAEGIAYDTPDDVSTKLSPSGIRHGDGSVGRTMTQRDIDEVVDAFATAAANAKAIGFDGVELHGAHGYLIDQFFWDETNRRDDSYGGNKRERTRFGVEVVKEIRRRVGSEYPIILRFSQWKPTNYAAKLADTPEELAEVLEPLADAGVDIFHCSQRRFWEPEFPDSDLNLAGWTKKLTGRPTITVGSVGLDGDFLAGLFEGATAPVARIDQLLERLERGDFDLVAVGRALIADADWLEKIETGRTSDLRAYEPSMVSTLD